MVDHWYLKVNCICNSVIFPSKLFKEKDQTATQHDTWWFLKSWEILSRHKLLVSVVGKSWSHGPWRLWAAPTVASNSESCFQVLGHQYLSEWPEKARFFEGKIIFQSILEGEIHESWCLYIFSWGYHAVQNLRSLVRYGAGPDNKVEICMFAPSTNILKITSKSRGPVQSHHVLKKIM